MNTQDDAFDKSGESVEPDEGWWAAVLADEPMIDTSKREVRLSPAQKPVVDHADSTKLSINWEKVKDLFSKDEIIGLNVIGYNRGGVLVAAEDIQGFVPASHLIDLPANLSEGEREPYLMSYLERTISLKVIECECHHERVVFSERAALAGEGQRKHLLNSLVEGDVVWGTVTNVTSFGVFVDLGGLEGLIHVSELSWGRVDDPANILKVDDQIETLVLQVSEDEGRIALSLKRLKENPWIILANQLSPGDIIDAEISSIVKYGAFARLPEGIEGLIHISSMNFPEGCEYIDEFLYEGQPVKACVLDMDPVKHRLGLKLEGY